MAHARRPRDVLEIVLELLADHGVDDVHIIIANSLHRRMTDGEMQRMVGDEDLRRVLARPLYNHDAEDPDGMVDARQDRATARSSRSTAAPPRATCVIYVNINFVPMDGGHKSVASAVRLREPAAHHNAARPSSTPTRYMDPARSALDHSVERMGRSSTST